MVTTCIVHWQEPCKLKVYDKPVVCVTNSGKVLTFNTNCGKESTWLWHVRKYNVKYWAFVSEVIPFE